MPDREGASCETRSPLLFFVISGFGIWTVIYVVYVYVMYLLCFIIFSIYYFLLLFIYVFFGMLFFNAEQNKNARITTMSIFVLFLSPIRAASAPVFTLALTFFSTVLEESRLGLFLRHQASMGGCPNPPDFFHMARRGGGRRGGSGAPSSHPSPSQTSLGTPPSHPTTRASPQRDHLSSTLSLVPPPRLRPIS